MLVWPIEVLLYWCMVNFLNTLMIVVDDLRLFFGLPVLCDLSNVDNIDLF